MRAALRKNKKKKKKIPVFVSKFGEFVFNFRMFFFPLLSLFLRKKNFSFLTVCFQNVGGLKKQFCKLKIYITMKTGAFLKNKLHSVSIILKVINKTKCYHKSKF